MKEAVKLYKGQYNTGNRNISMPCIKCTVRHYFSLNTFVVQSMENK